MTFYQRACWGQGGVPSWAMDMGDKFPPEKLHCVSPRPLRIMGSWEARMPSPPSRHGQQPRPCVNVAFVFVLLALSPAAPSLPGDTAGQTCGLGLGVGLLPLPSLP